MTNHPLYIKLSELVIAGGYTPAQIRNVTRQQIENITGINLDRFTNNFLANVRESLAREAEARIDRQALMEIRAFVLTLFPNAEGKVNDRVVTIWLDGEPQPTVEA